jgi:hypothetical protein
VADTVVPGFGETVLGEAVDEGEGEGLVVRELARVVDAGVRG